MVPLRYSPGDQWVYGLGHDVQAYLVEHFSSMPYADYVREAILEPLGMRHTAFGVPQALKGQFAIAIVIMGQVMPNDGDLLQKVETLVYQALVDAP